MAKFVAAAAAIIVGILLIVIAVFYRQWSFERSLQSMAWRIPRAELILKRWTHGSVRSASSVNNSSVGGSRAISSVGNVRNRSHLSLRDYEANIIRDELREEAQLKQASRRPFKPKTAFDEPEERRWLELDDFALALYRGNLVGLKKIYKSSVDITRDVRKEMKTIREIHHDNLTAVLGAVHEPPHVFVVSEFAQRGSLKDILENDDFKLDDMFLASITTDIVKGMTYLHATSVGAHGRLKSSNCLVDARWAVRVADFGLRHFRLNEGDSDEVDGRQAGRGMLWTAPELLREALPSTELAIDVLQKADVYSFGIILHEIYGRMGPFAEEVLEPIEVVQRVKFVESPPFRPAVAALRQAPMLVKATAEQCWAETPTARPPFRAIRGAIKPLQKGMKTNIFDNMMALMERYTNNLEDVVSERTSQLDDERKKSERLLLQMLPRSVAETLKRGQAVDAEAFDSVSIYFSDIVGFTQLSSQSSPFEVVRFLNDLYTCFDSIISNYDVYKVETIGDAYMVVSGLPIANGDNHAGEIASMSLSLLEAVKTFKIRHRPSEMLKLRIGIHSGPCVSGVVGLKMPRYCLFGDTVNTASRMESNGEALKIHCSAQCEKLLEALGGYEYEERGYVAMKGKGEQLTYWVTAEDVGWRKERIERESEKYPNLKKSMNFA